MATGLQYRGDVAAAPAGTEPRSLDVRNAFTTALGLAFTLMILAAIHVLQATDREETILTVVVSSAEHEAQEGYFTLGETATVMVKPGSDLYKFLSRHRGKKVRISLTEDGRSGPPRLER